MNEMDYLYRRGIDPVIRFGAVDHGIVEYEERSVIDDFKDYPQTIGEIRSDQTQLASDWTPREALIDLLRQIDNGLDVPGIVISYTVKEEEDKRYTKYIASTQTHNEALAILTRAAWLVNVAT